MAALAIPLLELAGEGIAAAWAAFTSSGAATAVAGGAATAAVLSLPGDTTQDKDKAQAQTQATTRTQSRNCKCPPEKGQRLPPPHIVTGISAAYQQYVTGFPMGLEFFFAGKWFDGFYLSDCLLQEAKANYDFFFDDEDGSPKFFFFHGKGPNNPDPTVSKSAYKSIMREAETQSEVVISNPPAKLRWYFMQERFFMWATKEFVGEALPISTEYKPM